MGKIAMYRIGCVFNPAVGWRVKSCEPVDVRFKPFTKEGIMYVMSLVPMRPSAFMNPRVHEEAAATHYRVHCKFDMMVGWRAVACEIVRGYFKTVSAKATAIVPSHRQVLPSQFVNPYKLQMEVNRFKSNQYA